MVAPLSFGAGVKGKVCESLVAGVPVVTSTVGAEGLDVDDGEHLLIADDPDTMAGHVAAVLSDDELWRRLSCAGQARAEQLVGLDAGRARLRLMLDRLGVGAPDRRAPWF